MPKQPKKSTRGTGRTPPRKQRDGRPPVEDQPKHPRMGEVEIAPRRIDRKIVTMPDEPAAPRRTKGTMDPMPKRLARPKQSRPDRDQEAPAPMGSAERQAAETTGYLRLRFGVTGGEAQLKSARFVPGPFDRPQEIAAGLAFDARVGGRHVATGNIPDPTEYRSFPDPAGRGGMDHHHVTQVDEFDFTVRVPASEIDQRRLGELRVDVFRWRGKAPGERLQPEQISAQPKAAIERIAEVGGIETKALPTEVRTQLEGALRDITS